MRRSAPEAASGYVLNYHLMHPGGPSAPADPNAAFHLAGTYHLHYILRHPFRDGDSFSFVHVSSPDMLHWSWHKTSLQPAFTGHGMFSGTGFITREGAPAIIYHGHASGRNQIVVAKDNRLDDWEKPYPFKPVNRDGSRARIRHWDPDCFRIGDTYYAISGGRNPPLLKSKDLKQWEYLGKFLKHDLPDVAIGEDISCGNFFSLADKWTLLCISHPFGCRYYLGDWDGDREQFVPQRHGRMNWRRDDQSVYETKYRDFFAPESLLTPDGRRVMWAWCASLNEVIDHKSIQSLPRELSLPPDGVLRIKPLRELQSLRHQPLTRKNIFLGTPSGIHGGAMANCIARLNGDAFEIRIHVNRSEAERKRFGFHLFGSRNQPGFPILIQPENGTLRVGATEAPFCVADLPKGEDLQLRIFIDKYLVEVFANDRQAVVGAHMDYWGRTELTAHVFGGPTTIRRIDIWRLKSTNQGLLEAIRNPIWQPLSR